MTKRTRLGFNFFGAVLLFAISTVVALAQTSGEMSGLVTDPSGAAVSGASVTITNRATSATRNVITNAINIAMELSHRLDLKIIMTGGLLNKNSLHCPGTQESTLLTRCSMTWLS